MMLGQERQELSQVATIASTVFSDILRSLASRPSQARA